MRAGTAARRAPPRAAGTSDQWTFRGRESPCPRARDAQGGRRPSPKGMSAKARTWSSPTAARAAGAPDENTARISSAGQFHTMASSRQHARSDVPPSEKVKARNAQWKEAIHERQRLGLECTAAALSEAFGVSVGQVRYFAKMTGVRLASHHAPHWEAAMFVKAVKALPIDASQCTARQLARLTGFADLEGSRLYGLLHRHGIEFVREPAGPPNSFIKALRSLEIDTSQYTARELAERVGFGHLKEPSSQLHRHGIAYRKLRHAGSRKTSR